MRFAVALLVVALCLQMASGSVLVRFINTVPNTLETPTAFSAMDQMITPNIATAGVAPAFVVGNPPAGRLASGLRDDNLYELGSTRVGLKYVDASSDSFKMNTVWTEPNSGYGLDNKLHGVSVSSVTYTSGSVNGHLAGVNAYQTGASAPRVTEKTFAYQMAMPPLRAYHSWSAGATTPGVITANVLAGVTAGNEIAVDRVAHFQNCIAGSRPGATLSAHHCHACTTALGCGTAADEDKVQFESNAHVDPSGWDTMDHMGLKADGISQYMTFAAGTYKFQAYGIGGSTQFSTIGAGGTSTNKAGLAAPGLTFYGAGSIAEHGLHSGDAINTRPIVEFGGSIQTFEFEDWHVYTIVATGSVTWPAGATSDVVSLSLLDESIAPATFGKATVRFFHALKPSSANSMSVFAGVSSTSLATGVAFGTASAYVDIAPSTSYVFRLVAGDETSSTATTADLRAGTRATIICAVNDLDVAAGFCRQIPSRVVAYVRLVNDFEDVASHFAGKGGPTALKDIGISMYAQYDFPTASIQQIGSTDGAMAAHPANPIQGGLYPVVGETKAGSVTGYGEVHVPLFIMDKAVSQGIFMSGNGYSNEWTTIANLGAAPGAGFRGSVGHSVGPGGVAPASLAFDDFAKLKFFRGFSSDVWDGSNDGAALSCPSSISAGTAAVCVRTLIGMQGRDYAARYKRVNLVIKTDAFSTINDRALYSNAVNNVAGTAGRDDFDADGIPAHQLSSSIDIPMEPGQFYTFYATVTMASGGVEGAAQTNAYNGDGAPRVSTAAIALGGGLSRDNRALPAVEDNMLATGTGTMIANPANGRIIEFGLSLDRAVREVSTGITAGKAVVRFMPFGMVSDGHVLAPNGKIAIGSAVMVLSTTAIATPLTLNIGVTSTNTIDTGRPAAYGVLTATNDFDVQGVTGVSHAAVFVRQWHTVYPTFGGDQPHALSSSSPPPSKRPTVALKNAAGETVVSGINPISNYVRLDPHVMYAAQLKPFFFSNLVQSVEVDAGTYTWTVDDANWRQDPCMFTVPTKEITVAEGDVASIFVLNFYGCRSASSNQDTVSKLHTEIGMQTGYMATAAPAATQETFFGAASSVSASVALLFAGVIAILALAL